MTLLANHVFTNQRAAITLDQTELLITEVSPLQSGVTTLLTNHVFTNQRVAITLEQPELLLTIVLPLQDGVMTLLVNHFSDQGTAIVLKVGGARIYYTKLSVKPGLSLHPTWGNQLIAAQQDHGEAPPTLSRAHQYPVTPLLLGSTVKASWLVSGNLPMFPGVLVTGGRVRIIIGPPAGTEAPPP